VNIRNSLFDKSQNAHTADEVSAAFDPPARQPHASALKPANPPPLVIMLKKRDRPHRCSKSGTDPVEGATVVRGWDLSGALFQSAPPVKGATKVKTVLTFHP